MKALLVSVLSLSLLIAVWCVFDHYSDRQIAGLMERIEDVLIPAVQEGSWQDAEHGFTRFEEDWHAYRKISFYFIDRELINEVDFAIAKTLRFIQAKDDSNASGELSFLQKQLLFLQMHERFHIENLL